MSHLAGFSYWTPRYHVLYFASGLVWSRISNQELMKMTEIVFLNVMMKHNAREPGTVERHQEDQPPHDLHQDQQG
jgi:hypothetical protein